MHVAGSVIQFFKFQFVWSGRRKKDSIQVHDRKASSAMFGCPEEDGQAGALPLVPTENGSPAYVISHFEE